MVIICVLKNWLGDVIFSSPAIRTIRMNYPAAQIICLAPKRCLNILQANPNVDEVICFDERHEQKSLIEKWKLVLKLRRFKPDQVYLFHRSLTRAFLMFLTGAKERIGYAGRRAFLLTKAIREPKEKLHAVDYNLELLRRSGFQVTGDALYEFRFDKKDLENAKKLIAGMQLGHERVVAIHPGANWPHKRWPAGHFRLLVQELVRRYRISVIITGGADDRVTAERIASEVNNPYVRSFAGKTNLKELGALFSLCTLVISSDSGPLHVAGGVGANVLGIFGPTDPALTGPRGRGKNIVIHYVPEGMKCPWFGDEFPKSGWMEHIQVNEVLQTIERERLL